MGGGKMRLFISSYCGYTKKEANMRQTTQTTIAENGVKKNITKEEVNELLTDKLSGEVPLMDGTANAGNSTQYARGDHRHPENTNKVSKSELLDLIYPVGSIYLSVNSVNPKTLFGGTWAKIEGRFLLGSSSGYSLGHTGGEATHTLTTMEMPSHTHSFTGESRTTDYEGNHSHRLGRGAASSDKQTFSQYDNTGHYTLTDSGARTMGHTVYAGNHLHTFTPIGRNSETGGSYPHNNMPPYIVVSIWERTA